MELVGMENYLLNLDKNKIGDTINHQFKIRLTTGELGDKAHKPER